MQLCKKFQCKTPEMLFLSHIVRWLFCSSEKLSFLLWGTSASTAEENSDVKRCSLSPTPKLPRKVFSQEEKIACLKPGQGTHRLLPAGCYLEIMPNKTTFVRVISLPSPLCSPYFFLKLKMLYKFQPSDRFF